MKSFWLIAPYAAWMVLMMSLPSTPWAYAARTATTLILLVVSLFALRGQETGGAEVRAKGCVVSDGGPLRRSFCPMVSGLLVGILVLVIWIVPDQFSWYRKFCVIGDPYSSAEPLSLSSYWTWIQLFGSAFVISVAEELFFRKWLIRYAGFWWMVALFAVEHDRYVVGAICGVLYGILYLRKGLLAAIVAHVTTNLLLGLYVIQSGHWEFW